ncbi:MAG: choice-of-anchor D domain-containing protein [bacterium]
MGRCAILGLAICAALVAFAGGCSEESPLVPGRCSVDAGALEFGKIVVGESDSRSFTVSNAGQLPIAIDVELVDDDCGFTIEEGAGASELGPGSERVVTVRFAPAARETLSCAIAIGSDCAAVSCMGIGDAPPQCEVTPDSIDFGEVSTGDGRNIPITITNTGGGTLTGGVSLSRACPEFAVRGDGLYELAGGESRDIEIRFTPALEIASSCSVLVGGGGSCGTILLRGAGGPPPVCAVSPASLDFGTVVVGDTLTLEFEMTNQGGGLLEGSVSLPLACRDFFFSGGVSYSLGPAQSQTFTIRFQPIFQNTQICTIEIGSRGCSDIPIVGFGEPFPRCEIDSLTLDFGDVAIGASADRSIVVWNAGGGVLFGVPFIDDICPQFTLVGNPSFALAADETTSITVRFEPNILGITSCALDLGNPECFDLVEVFGAGIGAPVCDPSADTISFGTVSVGESADRTFSIRNRGLALLSGSVSETCKEFSIAGDPGYDLAPGDSVEFTLRFTPSADGDRTCEIDAGHASCPAFYAVGRGFVAADCEIASPTLNFGAVPLGESADLFVTIRNAGGDTLRGAIALPESCADFAILGDASYSLAANESAEVAVRFTPGAIENRTCTIETGSSLCGDVLAIGAGAFATSCSLSATVVDFGAVAVNTTQERFFAISNRGLAPLVGSVSLAGACPGFALASDPNYIVGAGQTESFVVQFSPVAEGATICTIETGTDSCPDITMIAEGFAPPLCSLSVSALDFGQVANGGNSDLAFTITNTGGGLLAGTVSESCGEFAILGDVTYSLAPDETQGFIARFSPASLGVKTCTIDAGAGSCATISATGEGTPPPVCVVEPEVIAFGAITAGDSADANFSITNTGGGILAGTVSEACGEFSIDGEASYSLAANASQVFTLRFKPVGSGAKSCAIQTGAGACADISASGTGLGAPECSVTVSAINFGSVTVGDCAEAIFTIRNSGEQEFSGNVALSCASDYSIITPVGGAFTLPVGATSNVTIRYRPTSVGINTCSVSLGSICGEIPLTGAGAPAPVCSISPLALNFGSVAVGDTAELSFTITNAGSDTLTNQGAGPIIENCEEFSILGDAAYRLGPGQSEEFVVRYTPKNAGNDLCIVSVPGSLSSYCPFPPPPSDLCENVVCTGSGVNTTPQRARAPGAKGTEP